MRFRIASFLVISQIVFRASGAPPESLQPGTTSDTYVSVSFTATLGPSGYAQTPNGLTAIAGADNGASVNTNYNFPSVFLFISASPLLTEQLSNDSDLGSIAAVKDGDRDIKWMDGTFEITPEDDSGSPIANGCPTDLQLIGMSPGTTLATTRTPVANTAASAADQLSSALGPFYPGLSSVTNAATSGLQVLFNDIFPPKAMPYQYAFMDGPCKFGWYFKQEAITSPAVSILGTQSGLILLRTTKRVKKIKVSGRIVSQWTKPPSKTQHEFWYYGSATELPIIESKTSYDNLQDLSLFPMLIPVADVKKILHINDKDDTKNTTNWNSLVTPQGNQPASIKTTPDGNYVLKGSLQTYLGISSPSPSGNATVAGAAAPTAGH